MGIFFIVPPLHSVGVMIDGITNDDVACDTEEVKGEWLVQYNEQIRDVFSSNIIRVIKSSILRMDGYMAHVQNKSNVLRVEEKALRRQTIW